LVNLWKVPERTFIAYPPCDVTEFATIPMNPTQGRLPHVLSIGQFRPEKDHELQLRAFAEALKNPSTPKEARLVIIGGARHKEDKDLVDKLKQKAEDLNIQDYVDFKVNAPFSELKGLMAVC